VLLNVNPDPTMGNGKKVWDPLQPAALKDTKDLVAFINANLDAGMPKAIGSVFDGDADRISAVLENGWAVPAFEMTLPYYQRFLMDEDNQGVFIKLIKAGADPLKLVCDVRANNKLLKYIDIVDNMLKEKAGITDTNRHVIEGWDITTGYPPQLGFMQNRIRELDNFVNSRPALKNDPAFMSDFEHMKKTYFTAEASGHNFFHISARYPNRVCDCAISGFLTLLGIKETMLPTGVPAGVTGRDLTDLFANFPVTYSSDETRVGIPNNIKIETAHAIGRWMRETYGPRLKPIIEAAQEDDYLIQPKDSGFITVSGYKIQLTDGTTALVRWSNTDEKLTTMFEGYDWDSLIKIMEEIEARLSLEVSKGVDLKDLRNEILRVKILKQIEPINKIGLYRAEVFIQQKHVLVKFTDQKEPGTNFTVMADQGFRVISWSVAGQERLKVPKDLNKELGAGIFSMFPWVNRIKDGKIVRNGRTIDISKIPGISFDKNDQGVLTKNPTHGVARVSESWKDFTLGMDGKGIFIQASFETTDYKGLSEALGHSKLTKKFYLSDRSLTTKDTVENLTTEAEAKRDGGYEVISDVGEHPFLLYTPGRTTLQAAVEGVFPVDSEKIPTGNPVSLPPEKDFNSAKSVDATLDNTFKIAPDVDGVVKVVLNDEVKGKTAFQMTGMFSTRFVHLWGGKVEGTPYYGVGAVEAVSVTANGPNRQRQVGGTEPLARQEVREGSVTMTVDIGDKPQAAPAPAAEGAAADTATAAKSRRDRLDELIDSLREEIVSADKRPGRIADLKEKHDAAARAKDQAAAAQINLQMQPLQAAMEGSATKLARLNSQIEAIIKAMRDEAKKEPLRMRSAFALLSGKKWGNSAASYIEIEAMQAISPTQVYVVWHLSTAKDSVYHTAVIDAYTDDYEAVLKASLGFLNQLLSRHSDVQLTPEDRAFIDNRIGENSGASAGQEMENETLSATEPDNAAGAADEALAARVWNGISSVISEANRLILEGTLEPGARFSEGEFIGFNNLLGHYSPSIIGRALALIEADKPDIKSKVKDMMSKAIQQQATNTAVPAANAEPAAGPTAAPAASASKLTLAAVLLPRLRDLSASGMVVKITWRAPSEGNRKHIDIGRITSIAYWEKDPIVYLSTNGGGIRISTMESIDISVTAVTEESGKVAASAAENAVEAGSQDDKAAVQADIGVTGKSAPISKPRIDYALGRISLEKLAQAVANGREDNEKAIEIVKRCEANRVDEFKALVARAESRAKIPQGIDLKKALSDLIDRLLSTPLLSTDGFNLFTSPAEPLDMQEKILEATGRADAKRKAGTGGICAYVFTESATFGRDYGLGVILPAIAQKNPDDKVAVILSKVEAIRAHQRNVIEELNAKLKLLGFGDRKIECVESIDEAPGKLHAAHCYYFKTKEDKDSAVDGHGLTVINVTADMANEIIKAIGGVLRITINTDKDSYFDKLRKEFVEIAA